MSEKTVAQRLDEDRARKNQTIAYWRERSAALSAATARVRDLHTQPDDGLAPGKWCPACGWEAPCPTIRALDGDA